MNADTVPKRIYMILLAITYSMIKKYLQNVKHSDEIGNSVVSMQASKD